MTDKFYLEDVCDMHRRLGAPEQVECSASMWLQVAKDLGAMTVYEEKYGRVGLRIHYATALGSYFFFLWHR